MKPFHWLIFSLISSAAIFSGCGKKAVTEKSDHDHAGHTHHEIHDDHPKGTSSEHEEHSDDKEHGVTFDADHGLKLSHEVIEALGLRTVAATEHRLVVEQRLTAQIFATSPQLLASACIPASEAGPLEKLTFAGAKLLRVDRSLENATRLVDLVFELNLLPAPPTVGDFITLSPTGESNTVLAVPHAALLDAASGTFVYVSTADGYRRTPVKTGARSAEFIEITSGISSGDVVVLTPVDQLWLAELRLTKGGGHSH